MIKQKLHAFTILEVSIVMLLAALVIAIAYTALSLTGQSYTTFNTNNKKSSELNLADKLLKRDFMDARLISRTSNGLDFETAEGLIHYVFNNTYLIRNQYNLRTDTLHLFLAEPLISFEKQPCTEGERADYLEITATINQKPLLLSYSKLYSSEELINP